MARADGRLRNLLTRLNRIDVLVIDDWAMAPLSEPERRDVRMVPSVEVTVALHDNRRASQPKCNYSEVDCIHLNGATDGGRGMLASGTDIVQPTDESYPRTVRYCTVCHAHTPHELRPASMVCVFCAAAVLEQDLDRD
jgi:hypothetical protein